MNWFHFQFYPVYHQSVGYFLQLFHKNRQCKNRFLPVSCIRLATDDKPSFRFLYCGHSTFLPAMFCSADSCCANRDGYATSGPAARHLLSPSVAGSVARHVGREKNKKKNPQQATSSAGGASLHSQTDVERDVDPKSSRRISSQGASKRDIRARQQDR